MTACTCPVPPAALRRDLEQAAAHLHAIQRQLTGACARSLGLMIARLDEIRGEIGEVDG